MDAALFDLDGVLVDTEGIYTEIWRAIDRAYPTGIDGFALKIKGSTLPQILDTYYPNAAVQAAVVRMLKDSEGAMQYRIFAGVESFLARLRAQGIPAAIVTSSNRAKMDGLFAQLPAFARYFDAVLTDADTTHSKPHPECYLNAAARLGVNPTRAFVFEDSFAGLEAGRRAGATVVALATTNSRQALEGMADIYLDGFEGLTVEKLLSMLP